MKLVTFRSGGKIGAGFVDGKQIVVCAEGEDAAYAVRSLIETGPEGIQDWAAKGANAERVALADVTLLAPIPEPRRDVTPADLIPAGRKLCQAHRSSLPRPRQVL